MSLLLDTHVLLWWSSGDSRLGPRARQAVVDARPAVHVSAISAWEIELKRALGRLQAPDVVRVLHVEGFRELELTVEHGIRAGALPLLHRDPFDRALVAQALAEGLTLVTADRALGAYGVEIFDAGA